MHDHSRFACMESAGISFNDLLADGIGPINIETTIRYRRELRASDEVDVSCRWTWGAGKTYRVEHALRTLDSEVAAEVNYLSGLLDLQTRRLVRDPAGELRRRATQPALLGLGPLGARGDKHVKRFAAARQGDRERMKEAKDE